MQLLTSLPICHAIYERILAKSDIVRSQVHLAVILVGNDARSLRFVFHKEKKARELGYQFTLNQLEADCSEQEVINAIIKLNHDPCVTGILLQLPLPQTMRTWDITRHIDPKKDVDCLTPYRMGSFTTGQGLIYPGTAKAIELICQFYKIQPQGKHVLILGDSNLVGKPAALWCLQNQATITVCNEYTPCLQKLTQNADIIISATGKKGLISPHWLHAQHIIFDIGIHVHEKKVTGDLDCQETRDRVAKITPVPGGIGPLTVAVLMDHLLQLQSNHEGPVL